MNKSARQPCLVTGGCGFVGRHLALRLLNEGHDVWLVDDLSVGRHPREWLPQRHLENPRRIDGITYYNGSPSVVFIHADARALFGARLPIEIPRFSDVFHLAAVVGGRAVIEGNPLAVAVDLALDAECFNWAVRARPQRLLYASSSAAYPVDLQGDGGAVALKESDIEFGGRLGQPDMTYGWSKLTGEYLARMAASRHGLHTACIRPFSGYGEDQDETYPVPAIAARAARGEDPLMVWGSGRQGRDFVHIDDCIQAMLLALDRIHDGSAVNIGSGRLLNFMQVARLFADLAGYAPEVVPMVGKPEGVHSRYADTRHMVRTLQWQPQISVEEGFGRVLAAAQQRLDLRTVA
jgi:UDP-glucose 4-epimerase